MPLPVQWKMLCPGQLQKHLMPNNQGHLLKCTGPKCEFTCKGSVPRMEFYQSCSTAVGGVKNPLITINNAGIPDNASEPPCVAGEIVIINDAVPTPINSTVEKGFLVAGIPPWVIAEGFVVLNIGLGPLNFAPQTPFFSPIVATNITGAVTGVAITQPTAPIPRGGFVGVPIALSGTALGPFSISLTVFTDDLDEGVFLFNWEGTIV